MTSSALVGLIAGYRWFGQAKVGIQADEIYAAANLVQTRLCSELHLLEQKGTLALTSGQSSYFFSPLTITGATNTNPIILTIPGHTFHTGDTVVVNGVLGNTAANVRTTVTYVSSTQVSLDGTTGNSAYISGGKAYHCILQASEIIGDIQRTSPSFKMIRRRPYNWIQVNSEKFNSTTDEVNWYYQVLDNPVSIGFLGTPNASMVVEFMYYRIPLSVAEDVSATVDPIVPAIFDKLLYLKVLYEALDMFKSEPGVERERGDIERKVKEEEARVLMVQSRRKFTASIDYTGLRF
jgi:hypothetical protein